MKPIETKTTNCVYTLEGCHDLPATNFHSNVGEGVPPMCLNTYTSLVESENGGNENEQIN